MSTRLPPLAVPPLARFPPPVLSPFTLPPLALIPSTPRTEWRGPYQTVLLLLFHLKRHFELMLVLKFQIPAATSGQRILTTLGLDRSLYLCQRRIVKKFVFLVGVIDWKCTLAHEHSREPLASRRRSQYVLASLRWRISRS